MRAKRASAHVRASDISTYLSTHPPPYPPIHLSVYLSIAEKLPAPPQPWAGLAPWPTAAPPPTSAAAAPMRTCAPAIYSPIYPPIYLSIPLPIYLSICLALRPAAAPPPPTSAAAAPLPTCVLAIYSQKQRNKALTLAHVHTIWPRLQAHLDCGRAPAHVRASNIFIGGSKITGDTSTHAQGTDLGGASRASKGQEALWPPVLKARRRRKRQHLHRNKETKP